MVADKNVVRVLEKAENRALDAVNEITLKQLAMEDAMHSNPES